MDPLYPITSGAFDNTLIQPLESLFLWEHNSQSATEGPVETGSDLKVNYNISCPIKISTQGRHHHPLTRAGHLVVVPPQALQVGRTL